MTTTPPTLAGLFFCLASRHSAGLLFCPDTIQPNTSVYIVFCRVNAIIPPTPQSSAQGFTGAFPTIAPAQPPTIPARHKRLQYHLHHAGRSTSARTRSADTRTTATHGRCAAQHRPPIIIRYIRGQTMPPGGGSSYRVRIAGKCCTRRTC